MTTNFDTNAANGIEIDSIFSNALAYGTADDGNNQRRNKKYGKVKALVFVSAAVAFIFGWTALSGMNQPNYDVQGNEMMERNLAKSTKGPTASKTPKRRELAKSTKGPTASKTPKRRELAKSTKGPTASKAPKRRNLWVQWIDMFDVDRLFENGNYA